MEKKWHYVIPPDTTETRIVWEHPVLNFTAMAADVICAILIFVGLEQRIVTYAGLVSIAMCILAEQGKIYSEQYQQLASGTNVCFIKGKEWKILKKYTPNLGRVIMAVVFIVIFLVLALLDIFQNSSDVPNLAYSIAMLAMLLIMTGTKLKCCFLSTFVLKECIIKKKEEE